MLAHSDISEIYPWVRKFSPLIWEISKYPKYSSQIRRDWDIRNLISEIARFETRESVKITVFKLKPSFQNFFRFLPQKISEKSIVKDENLEDTPR